MIVDDHSIVRSGLGAFLAAASDQDLVGEAANSEQAVVRANAIGAHFKVESVSGEGTQISVIL